jgi:hypothetical protein
MLWAVVWRLSSYSTRTERSEPVCGPQKKCAVRMRPSAQIQMLIVTLVVAARDVLFSIPGHTGSEACPPPSTCTMGYHAPFPGVKRPGPGVYHPLTPSAEIKNEWGYRPAPTSTLCLHGMSRGDLYPCLCYTCFGRSVAMLRKVRADSKQVIGALHPCKWRVFWNIECQPTLNMAN